MKKKCLVMIMTVCLSAALLSGCGRKNNNNTTTESETGSVAEESTIAQGETNTLGSTMDDFQNLLTSTNNDEDVYQFMDQNVGQFESGDVDTLVTGIIGFHDDISQVDFERIGKHTDAMSDEMREYVELMMMEQETPYVSNGETQITLTDLLNRCKSFEDHLTKYPNGATYQYAYERYYELLNQAITGGYDGTDQTTHFYSDEENNNNIDDMAVDAYQAFIDANPDSMTAQTLTEYVGILNDNNNSLNDNVTSYYGTLGESIQSRFNS